MKMKNYLLLLTLFMVLMCCVSAISASSDDAINDTLSEIDSGDEAISVSNDENTVTEIDSGDEAISVSNDENTVTEIDSGDEAISTSDGEQAVGVDESDSALSANENDEFIGQNQEDEKLSDPITIDGITYDVIYENQEIDLKDLEGFMIIEENTLITNCNISNFNSAIYDDSAILNYGAFYLNNSIINIDLFFSVGQTIINNCTLNIDSFIVPSGEVYIDDYTDISNSFKIFSIDEFVEYFGADLNTIKEEMMIDEINGKIITNNPKIVSSIYDKNLRNYDKVIINIGESVIENENVNFTIINLGNITFIDSTINSEIINKGNLYFSNGNTFLENYTLSEIGRTFIEDYIMLSVKNNGELVSTLNSLDDENFKYIIYLENGTYINSENIGIKQNITVMINGNNQILSSSNDLILIENQGNTTINNLTLNHAIINKFNLTFNNSILNSTVSNEGILIISDDTVFGNEFVIKNNGTVIINDTNRLIPYLSEYNGTYILENIIINRDIKNYGNLTLINSTINGQINNYGNITFINSMLNSSVLNNGRLTISDDTLFGDLFLEGNGEVIINDTSRLAPYLAILNDTFTLENFTFNRPVENYGNLTLINPKFNARITNYGNIIIINSIITSYNILIKNSGETEIIDSTVINSSAYGKNIINCTFINSSGSGSNILNCTFINSSGSGSNTINCTFINSSSSGTNIINCTFIRSYCSVGNGLVENCSFINNTKISDDSYSGPAGGALIINNGTVKNSIFINNGVKTTSTSVGSGASGGAIYSGNNLIVDNCTFEDNYAISSSTWMEYQGGGAIRANKLTVTNSKFINNYVESPHGTTWKGIAGQYGICECGMGGAILAITPSVTIINNTFTSNRASIDGSAIFIRVGNSNEKITIKNNNFTDNGEAKDTIFLRNYVEKQDGSFTVEYYAPTTDITNNNYLNNSISYKVFELTAPEDVYTGDTVTVKLNIELEHPEFYDSDMLDQCNYTWYVNGELITNQETEMTTQITGNYITYVTPSISNSRSEVLAIIPTVLTDIIITPENIDTYLFDGTLIVSDKSHLIFEGDFKDIGLMKNSKDNVIFDCENATFTNTAVEINANKNVIKNMKINSTDMSEYLISLSGDDNKILNSTLIQYNSNGKTAAIYNDNGNNNLISGNIIDVTGPSLGITWTEGANAANTQGILCVGGANNIIELNTIRVGNSTDPELAQFGTMEGITAPLGENLTITKNNVYTTGARFNYGINTLTDVINNKITENNITVTGYRYADGIQVGDGAIGNIIANNSIYITCINETPVDEAAMSYGIILTSQGGRISDNNTIAENNIVINGIVNYGMEIYTVTNTIISKNNITLNGAKSMGIGYAHAPNSTVSENIIRISDDSTIHINSVTEEIQPASVGIRVQQGSDNVAITDNVIIVNDKAKTDYTVSTVDENTTVTDNILVSSKGYGDETVISTEAATIENNIADTITKAGDVVGNVNKTVTLQANVTLEIGDNVNGGIVEFTDGEGNVIAQANVVNGVATATATFADEMNANLTATYKPASTGLITSQDEFAIEITTAKAASILNADDEFNMTYKDGSAWVVTLTDADGNPIAGAAIKVGIYGKLYNRKTDADGVARLVVNLAPGSYAVNATFEGDGTYESAFVNGTVTVNKAASVLSGDNIVMSYKDGNGWVITLTDANNSPIAGAAIKVGIYGKLYNRKTDAEGNACLVVNLAPGSYAVNATFAGNRYYESAFVEANVTVNKANVNITGQDLVMTYQNGSYAVSVVDAQGNPLANVVVKFTIGNSNYKAKTDANGVASLKINCIPGEFRVTAVVNDTKYVSESITNTITVNTEETYSITANDVNMTYKDGTAYEVQLVNSEGQAVALRGQIVKITVKGITYNAKTDSNGIARLTINLNAGTYTFTAEYDGNEINSTVIVNKS